MTSCKFWKKIFPHKVYLRRHWKQRGRRKGGQNQRRVNGAPKQMLGTRTPWVNGQGLIVKSGNYCYSSFRISSMDVNKTQPSKDYRNSYSNHMSKSYSPGRGQKRGASCWGWSSGPNFRKIRVIIFKQKQKLLKLKTTIQIATFNDRTLKRIGQLPEQTKSAIDHKIDIVCAQEHRYFHSKEVKYHDNGNGWTFVSVSA